MKHVVAVLWVFVACLRSGWGGESNRVHVSICSDDAVSHGLQFLANSTSCRICYQAPAYYDLPDKAFGKSEGMPYLGRTPQTLRFSFDRTNNVAAIIEAFLAEYKKVDPDVQYRLDTQPGSSNYYVWPVSWKGVTGGGVTNNDVLEVERTLKCPTNATVGAVVRLVLEKVAHESPYEKEIRANLIPLRFPDAPAPMAVQNIFTSPLSARTLLDAVCRISPSREQPVAWHFHRVPPGETGSYVTIEPVYPVPSEHDRYIETMCIGALAFAFDEVERTYGFPIGFEEPELLYSGYVADKSGKPCATQVLGILYSYNSRETFRTVLPGLVKYLDGRSDDVYFRIDELRSNAVQVIPAYRIVPEYERSKTPDAPSRVEGIGVSDTHVSIALKSVEIEDGIRAICREAAKAAGRIIEVGTVSVSDKIKGKKVEFSCENMAMNKCLTELLKQYSPMLSWRLHYDPKRSGHTLKIHEVLSIGSP